jgi:hypothetical protein
MEPLTYIPGRATSKTFTTMTTAATMATSKWIRMAETRSAVQDREVLPRTTKISPDKEKAPMNRAFSAKGVLWPSGLPRSSRSSRFTLTRCHHGCGDNQRRSHGPTSHYLLTGVPTQLHVESEAVGASPIWGCSYNDASQAAEETAWWNKWNKWNNKDDNGVKGHERVTAGRSTPDQKR